MIAKIARYSFVFGLTVSSAYAGFCDNRLSMDPAQFDKYRAFECVAKQNAKVGFCAVVTEGYTDVIYPGVSGDVTAGESTDANDTIRLKGPAGRAGWDRSECVASEGGSIPFYTERHCTRYSHESWTVDLDLWKKTAKLAYSNSEARNPKANYDLTCTATTSGEDKLAKSLVGKALKNAEGAIVIVNSVDLAKRTLSTTDLLSAKASEAGFSEIPHLAALSWGAMGGALKPSVIDVKSLAGGKFSCLVSSEKGDALLATSGIGKIGFSAVERKKNDIDLVSSAKLSLVSDFADHKMLPNGGASEILMDSDTATVIVKKREGGVDYQGVLFLDSAEALPKVGVKADIFVLPGTVCFR